MCACLFMDGKSQLYTCIAQILSQPTKRGDYDHIALKSKVLIESAESHCTLTHTLSHTHIHMRMDIHVHLHTCAQHNYVSLRDTTNLATPYSTLPHSSQLDPVTPRSAKSKVPSTNVRYQITSPILAPAQFRDSLLWCQRGFCSPACNRRENAPSEHSCVHGRERSRLDLANAVGS